MWNKLSNVALFKKKKYKDLQISCGVKLHDLQSMLIISYIFVLFIRLSISSPMLFNIIQFLFTRNFVCSPMFSNRAH